MTVVYYIKKKCIFLNASHNFKRFGGFAMQTSFELGENIVTGNSSFHLGRAQRQTNGSLILAIY